MEGEKGERDESDGKKKMGRRVYKLKKRRGVLGRGNPREPKEMKGKKKIQKTNKKQTKGTEVSWNKGRRRKRREEERANEDK